MIAVQFRIGGALVVAAALLVSEAVAQVPDRLQAGGTSRQRRLSDRQIREILLLRALQSRGRGGNVKRGVPQFVPFGNPWSMAIPPVPSQGAQQAADGKRAQTRAARAERLRQAREKQIAEREEAVRQRAKARAARAKAARAKAKDRPSDPP